MRMNQSIKVNYNIRPGASGDLGAVISLMRNCAQHLIQEGIYQWDHNYPSVLDITAGIDRTNLWVYEIDKGIVGTVTIDENQSPEYLSLNWNSPNFLVIHRLAVLPECQGKGIARKLMDFAETKVSELGYDSIRLDTYSLNTRNVRFYNNRGYQKIGEVYFRGIREPFLCFEKILKS